MFADACTSDKADKACNLVIIVFEIFKHFYEPADFAHNPPSGQAGQQAATFAYGNLNGYVETVYVQLYDPYNFQNVNFF
jgi:hypothetical protein